MKGLGKKPVSRQSTITKEFLIGLLAILWGGYNLLYTFNVIPQYVDTSKIQIVGSILLVLAGFLLWFTAFKLGRYKYHTRHLI